MQNSIQVAAAQSGLTLKAFRGDGGVLLGFDLDQNLTTNFAGFAVQCTPPNGSADYLLNRLSFDTPITATTTPQQRTWTPSNLAPFQKFRWMHFPTDVVPGTYTYTVTAMYFDSAGSTQLTPGVSASISLDLVPSQPQFQHFEMGFTRGDLSSQAYATKFKNALIEPAGSKTLDYDTAPYAAQYAWLGYHARKMIFDFLQECLADPEVTLDLFAYDIDEPDIVRLLQQFGPRLRAVLDDAPLHTAPGAVEPQVWARLKTSAGAANIVTGHFKRFAHDKVLIKKDKDNNAVKVLTGSANFSIRGLYVQANNVLIFDDPGTAALYEQAFETAFTDMAHADQAAAAGKWFDVGTAGIPPFSVSFAPHTSANTSLDKVSAAIQNAQSSVLFAVMELNGGGDVLNQLRNLTGRAGIFSYGITQAMKSSPADQGSSAQSLGVNLYKPGQSNGILTSFAFLQGQVSSPFQAEWGGGLGQVIHDKFIVVDFNDQTPLVFTGSSNLSEGGEMENGDNLLCISDRATAIAYAVEATRLVDHYHFRAVMQSATSQQPLKLQPNEANWWAPYYDSANIKFRERILFSR
jgi:phosphatidylserine/phosphatidylglycerophosphate/cardiolipin synthase-like enzyme